MCTHCNNLTPVPCTPMVIKSIMASTRSHDFGTQCNGVDVGPFAFHSFAVGSGHPSTIIERPYALTFLAVSEDMEFGDYSGKQVVEIKLQVGGEFDNAGPQIDTP